MKKFLYGPVFSKRFGKSLGVDLLPHKTCNFNCVYCQLGESFKLVCERKEFYPADEIISWIKENLKKYPEHDFITFSGNGEPLLYKRINRIIDFLKEFQEKPIIILTNGSLFYLKEVREEVKNADIIVPSLLAGNEKTFLKIARPCKNIKFENIIEGIINLRKEFKGKIYIEIMFIKDLNDNEEEIYGMKRIIEKINPDKVFLNTPTRPPALKWVTSPSYEKLELIKSIIGGEIVKERKIYDEKIKIEEIINIIEKRPLPVEEIMKRLKINDVEEVKKILKEKEERIKFVKIEDKEYATY